MTVSAIWWSRASGVALVGLALVAAGCTPGGVVVSAPSGKPAPAPPAAAEKAPAQAGLGLVPLPSPQQVSAAVALGRLDPFSSPVPPSRPQAAVGGAPGSTATGAGGATAGGGAAAVPKAGPPALPADFQFSGVITSRGRAEALVQTVSDSGTVQVGTVQVGDIGRGSANPWLPQGWSVDAIDARQGVLTLRQGSRTRSFKLI